MTGDLVNQRNPRTGPTFGWRNRVRRALWGTVQATLFRWSPRPLHRWRAALLRAFGARLGHNVHVYGKCRIWAPWNLDLADEACLADDVIAYSMATIRLGPRAIVSQGAHLCTGTHDFTDPSFQLYAEPICIGEDAWVCADVFIGPGVTVGDGAVIGARAVVTKDQPAWTVCAGHPCRPLKPRVMQPERPEPA